MVEVTDSESDSTGVVRLNVGLKTLGGNEFLFKGLPHVFSRVLKLDGCARGQNQNCVPFVISTI